MNQVMTKKEFWYKNVPVYERRMFQTVLLLNYLSILLETIFLCRINSLIKNETLLDTLNTYLHTLIPLHIKAENWLLFVKYSFIIAILFQLIWTVFLKITKSRIMITTMLVFTLLGLLYSLLGPVPNLITIATALIQTIIYFPAAMASYSFWQQWNIYQSGSCLKTQLPSKSDIQEASLEKETPSIYYEPFQPEKTEENTVSLCDRNASFLDSHKTMENFYGSPEEPTEAKTLPGTDIYFGSSAEKTDTEKK